MRSVGFEEDLKFLLFKLNLNMYTISSKSGGKNHSIQFMIYIYNGFGVE